MRKPEDVNPKNFRVDKIIYQDKHFAIAEGVWVDDNTQRWGMRWNGDPNDPTDVGYPSVFKHPMWFQLPEDFKTVIINKNFQQLLRPDCIPFLISTNHKMNNLLTRISIQLEGRKHSSYSSDAGLNGTKELFDKIESLGGAQYYNLKRLKVGQTFTFDGKSFVVTDIELQHSPENQFGDSTDESLDIHIRVKEEN